jgi:hypothetical protein
MITETSDNFILIVLMLHFFMRILLGYLLSDLFSNIADLVIQRWEIISLLFLKA